MLLLSGCTNLDQDGTDGFIYDEHVVFQDVDRETAELMKSYLITYFKNVAIGSEFGDKSPVLKKWKEPMKIFVGGSPSDTLLTELDEIIAEINGHAIDGFNIQKVTDSLDSNFYLYFGSHYNYAKKYSYLAQLIVENKGLFTFFHDSDFWIYKGHMYVDIERAVITEQRHLLREELTQSLGLANDIPYDRSSIFYKEPSRTTEYSRHDIEVIRLLYHPALIAGLSEESVQGVLENLLRIDN